MQEPHDIALSAAKSEVEPFLGVFQEGGDTDETGRQNEETCELPYGDLDLLLPRQYIIYASGGILHPEDVSPAEDGFVDPVQGIRHLRCIDSGIIGDPGHILQNDGYGGTTEEPVEDLVPAERWEHGCLGCVNLDPEVCRSGPGLFCKARGDQDTGVGFSGRQLLIHFILVLYRVKMEDGVAVAERIHGFLHDGIRILAKNGHRQIERFLRSGDLTVDHGKKHKDHQHDCIYRLTDASLKQYEKPVEKKSHSILALEHNGLHQMDQSGDGIPV